MPKMRIVDLLLVGIATCLNTGCQRQLADASAEEEQVSDAGILHNSPFGWCEQECVTAADCAREGEVSPSYWDEDNYECTDGICVHAGCNSDAECQSDGNENFVCVSEDKRCKEPCSNVSDCGDVPEFVDEDWDYETSCTDGFCGLTINGLCNEDVDCHDYPGAALLPDHDFHCVEVRINDENDPIRSCNMACDGDSDCAELASVVDSYLPMNLVCTNGYCENLGCLETSECREGTRCVISGGIG